MICMIYKAIKMYEVGLKWSASQLTKPSHIIVIYVTKTLFRWKEKQLRLQKDNSFIPNIKKINIVQFQCAVYLRNNLHGPIEHGYNCVPFTTRYCCFLCICTTEKRIWELKILRKPGSVSMVSGTSTFCRGRTVGSHQIVVHGLPRNV